MEKEQTPSIWLVYDNPDDPVRVTKHERHRILGNEQGVVEREVGGWW